MNSGGLQALQDATGRPKDVLKPTEITAKLGFTVCKISGVVDVALP